MIFEFDDLWSRYLAWWSMLTISRSSSKVRGQRLGSRDDRSAITTASAVHKVNVCTLLAASGEWDRNFEKQLYSTHGHHENVVPVRPRVRAF